MSGNRFNGFFFRTKGKPLKRFWEINTPLITRLKPGENGIKHPSVSTYFHTGFGKVFASWRKTIMRTKLLTLILLFLISGNAALGQTSAFTYQGKLSDNGTAANGSYDIQFKLFDTATVGTGAQQGPTITNATVSATAGIFTVQLDFGASAFSGPPRFLEIGVRPAGNSNPYNLLTPRQPVTATPYAVRSLNSSVADTLSSACVGCVTSTQVGSVSGSVVSGTIPVAGLPAGSGNYLQNTISQQTGSNFNISGNGTSGGTLSANAVNATTQFNIGGARMLSAPGTNNLFAGPAAGNVNTGTDDSFFGNAAGSNNQTGFKNSFFGSSAGRSNIDGSNNSFFGWGAGFQNVSGTGNAFFGTRAGLNNTASSNSFFGKSAGDSNTTGDGNSFFGNGAGLANSTGSNNAFFGYNAGTNGNGVNNSFFGSGTGGSNSTGSNNSFFGYQSGSANTAGVFNVFVGTFAGNTNTTGDNNTIIGYNADVGSNNLNFATAIGAGAVALNSNQITLGRVNGSDTVEVRGPLLVDGAAQLDSGVTVANGDATFKGHVIINAIGSVGNTSVCLNASNQLALCSSSLRYKTAVTSFTGGLDVVRRLRPITFNWKDGGMHDIGFGAEEVNAVEPLLTTRNDKGEIEGVKYAQITTVLVNAVNEQQAQLAAQQRTIENQQQQIDTLMKQRRLLQGLQRMICRRNRRTEVCK